MTEHRTQPLSVDQQRLEEAQERLELIACRIGEEFNDELPPHETARADMAFLRDLASHLSPENSSGVEEGQPTIKFTTVEVGTAKDFRHLEQWPAGFTVCGVDMFPPADADGKPASISFSRGGGSSGKDPCPECVRRAQRFRSQRRITVTGLEAEAFHAAIPAEPPASTQQEEAR